MDLCFDWQPPIIIAKNKRIVITDNDLEAIERRAGIYYFARNFGENSEPFYVGKTSNLRARLKAHLSTVKIADVLRGMRVTGAPAISNGRRSFHYAYFLPKQGQSTKKSLQIAERFMIREALARNIPLLNSQLTVIKTHRLEFVGNGIARGTFSRMNSVAV